MTLLGILLGIYFVCNLAALGGWAGSVPSPTPILALVMGPVIWVVAVVTTGATTWVAYKFLPKEKPVAPRAATAADGGTVTVGIGRRIAAVTSREAGLIAAFSGITFAWNALGLIIVVFPPGSWSITGIMPQVLGSGTGPHALPLVRFLGGLLWYASTWGPFNFMLSSTWLI